MSASVPGLVRGIAVLELLADGRERTLEEITRELRAPKTSLLRVLSTLSDLGLVSRQEDSKRYASGVRLTPVPASGAELQAAVREPLQRLAELTGQTAEWWCPGEVGSILVQRAEAPDAEVRLQARVGYLRTWDGELESVNQLAWAFAPPGTKFPTFWTYVADGKTGHLAVERARRLIGLAWKNRTAADEFCNANGVRRLSGAVFQGPELAGILSLAVCYAPANDEQLPIWHDRLRREAATLSDHFSTV